MFQARREALLSRIGSDVAIIASTPLATRNDDVEHAYRQHSDLFYLTGFEEPETVLIVTGAHKTQRMVLFVRPKDKERETWDGRRAGVEGAVTKFGADAAYPISELKDHLPGYLEGAKRVHMDLGENPAVDAALIGAMRVVGRRERNGVTVPTAIVGLRDTLHEMRLHKWEDELAQMRTAAEITRDAHIRAMAVTRPGVFEYQIEGELHHVFLKRGARRPAYGTIVGSGDNATILHYTENDKAMVDGDLLLIDAGAEYGYYAADVTRTFPVNGKFTEAQREIYELVLAAEKAAVAEVRPGSHIDAVHDVAVKVLVEGLLRLNVLSGTVEENIASGEYKKFYLHRTSHWLGLDVHDAGAYCIDGTPRPFAPGQVLTVEPGLYFADTDEMPERYRGIGVRIEDNILVTEQGHENLTSAIPKEIHEIESLVGSATLD